MSETLDPFVQFMKVCEEEFVKAQKSGELHEIMSRSVLSSKVPPLEALPEEE